MKTPEEKIETVCFVLLGEKRKPTFLGQIWCVRYHILGVASFGTIGILLAVWIKDDFKLGLIIGLILAELLFNIGRAGFRARAVKTLMKEGII